MNNSGKQRDQGWLEDQLYSLWEEHFVDVPRPNPVLITFGRRSKRQLGCIKWADKKTQKIGRLTRHLVPGSYDDKRISIIIVTGYFKDTAIPDEVVLGTIAHEMCHYAHGFNSPLQQLYDHPHKGGVIRKEMQKRELGTLYKTANRWLKENWQNYLKSVR
ncbi:MAG: hypothetical protein TR69_WS6001001537 [candidate division WS6 bacterium OLB20]|uniref:SprT-like family protein n=1 Tax=candidate division WS6 bacterium OLB20 TaxID=1617426 RepID=A0A136LVP8_9BACT|nr:MAG: hypothetical protein TR69_WS6001001537 [candidate division WS6 bacterium OLB20]